MPRVASRGAGPSAPHVGERDGLRALAREMDAAKLAEAETKIVATKTEAMSHVEAIAADAAGGGAAPLGRVVAACAAGEPVESMTTRIGWPSLAGVV